MRNIVFQETNSIVIVNDTLNIVEKSDEGIFFRYFSNGVERYVSIRLKNTNIPLAFDKIINWLSTDKLQLIIRENKIKK